MKNIFAVPVFGKYLVHAPLHRLTALVNRQAARAIRDGLTTGIPAAGPVGALTAELASPASAADGRFSRRGRTQPRPPPRRQPARRGGGRRRRV